MRSWQSLTTSSSIDKRKEFLSFSFSYLRGGSQTGGRIADFRSLLGSGPRPQSRQHDDNDEEEQNDEEQDDKDEETARCHTQETSGLLNL